MSLLGFRLLRPGATIPVEATVSPGQPLPTKRYLRRGPWTRVDLADVPEIELEEKTARVDITPELDGQNDTQGIAIAADDGVFRLGFDGETTEGADGTNEQQTIEIHADGGTFRIAFDGHITGEEAMVNEQQTVTIDADDGTFTLTFMADETDPIAWNASAADVQAALEALDGIAPGDIIVTLDDQVYTVEFIGDLAALDVDEMTADDTLLTLGIDPGSATVETTVAGVPPTELAWNASAAVVQAALEALPNIGAGNVDVTLEGSTYTIEFVGGLSWTDVPEVTTVDSLIDGVGIGWTVIVTTVPGVLGEGLAWFASAADVQAALELLTNIGAGNVLVTKAGMAYTVEFIREMAHADQPEMTIDDAGLKDGLDLGMGLVITIDEGTTPEVAEIYMGFAESGESYRLQASSLLGLDVNPFDGPTMLYFKPVGSGLSFATGQSVSVQEYLEQ